MTSQALNQAIAAELGQGGELESSTGQTAVILRGKKVNHVLHAILSLLTAGLWLIVWVVLVATNKRQRIILSADASGTVSRVVTST